jgi:putative ABC transport system permease protein
MSVSSSIVRALVRGYPREFRSRYAGEVEENTRVLLHRAWQRGILAAIAMTARIVVDLLRSIAIERKLSRLRGDAPHGGRFAMGTFGQDLRDAFRQMRRNPGFATAVVLTLALAMGAVAAVFTIADPVLFRPLPYRDADRIVSISVRGGLLPLPYYGDYLRLRGHHPAFEAVAGLGDNVLGTLTADAPRTDDLMARGVTSGFFDVLGVRPHIGRGFSDHDHADASRTPAVITHQLWRARFGGEHGVLGSTLVLHGSERREFEIVGVLPREFVFPDFVNRAPAFFFPAVDDHALAAMPNRLARVFARIRPGVSLEQATSEVRAVLRAVEAENPRFAQGRQAVLRPLPEILYTSVRSPLRMLLGITLLVMLLAAANLAHLSLARGLARDRELATRQALGASRARLARMLAVESAVLACMGAVAATVVGRVLFDAVVAALPRQVHIYRAIPAAMDLRVLLFIALLAGVAFLMFGVLPAFRAARADLRGSVQSGPALSGLSHRLLVMAQTSAAVAIVLTALLLVGNFVGLVNQDLGYEPDGVVMAGISLPSSARNERTLEQASVALAARVEQMAGTPVALAASIPGLHLWSRLGRADDPATERFVVSAYPVTPAFFEVFEMTLLEGRLMTDTEAASSAPVAVVDQAAAALLWPGTDPLGQELRDSRNTLRQVIGVVKSVRTSVMPSDPIYGVAFVPLPSPARSLMVLWRGKVSPALDRDLAAWGRTLHVEAEVTAAPLQVFERSLGQPRFLAILLGTLGALAIALTVVGLYGVVSHGVARRTREMGIRIALGAETMRIARLIVMQTLKPAALGVGLGLAVSLWWTETMRAFLYAFSPHDWRMFIGAGGAVLGLVVLACIVPIRRATRVDPLMALKAE